jgi:hypothetical protein
LTDLHQELDGIAKSVKVWGENGQSSQNLTDFQKSIPQGFGEKMVSQSKTVSQQER